MTYICIICRLIQLINLHWNRSADSHMIEQIDWYQMLHKIKKWTMQKHTVHALTQPDRKYKKYIEI